MYELSNIEKRTIKEMVEEKLLKDIHDSFGVDFEKSFKVDKITQPLTVYGITKTFGLKNTDLNILLIQDKDDNDYKTIVINGDGKININIKRRWYGKIDNFYRKSDFDYVRKSGKPFVAYLIRVSNSLVPVKFNDFESNNYSVPFPRENKVEKLKSEFQKDLTLYNRAVKLESPKTYYEDGENKISGWYNVLLKDTKRSFEYELYHWDFKKYNINSQYDIIDKSGYNVNLKRGNLRDKANRLREERKLNEIKNTNFDTENLLFKERLESVKKVIIERLSNAEVGTEEFKTATYDICRVNDIGKEYKSHLECLKNVTENPSSYYSFSSVEEVKKSLVNLNEKIDVLLGYKEEEQNKVFIF